MSSQSLSEGTFFQAKRSHCLSSSGFGSLYVVSSKIIQMVSRGFTSPEFAGRLSLACSRLRDSRTSGIEKARTRKKKREETFSFFPPRPHFHVFPTQASNQDFM